MLPTEWGPIVWYNFHLLPYSYNEHEKLRYIKFFKSMPYILPCLMCTDHFKQTLNNSPPEKNITNKKSFIKWLVNAHNTVNLRLHKRVVSISEAEKIYNDENGNLKINHHKIAKFLKITKKYLSSGISSIIQHHGSNVIVNYCYICPCETCKFNMTTMIATTNVNKLGLHRLVNRMINIVESCDKIESKKIFQI